MMKIKTKQTNEAAALSALDGNRELLGELAQIFAEDTPVVLSELRMEMTQANAVNCCRLVHSLKGLISTFFAIQTTELASEIEKELKKGSLEHLSNGGFEQLSQSIVELTDELRALGYIK